jgi:hypothetical protein
VLSKTRAPSAEAGPSRWEGRIRAILGQLSAGPLPLPSPPPPSPPCMGTRERAARRAIAAERAIAALLRQSYA